MKSFNEYVEGIEGKMNYLPSKEDLEKWAKEDKDHEDKGNRIMKIAQSCFNTALDLVDEFDSLDDAIDSLALNAMHQAKEEGLSAADAMEAQSTVGHLYNKYKKQLKNK